MKHFIEYMEAIKTYGSQADIKEVLKYFDKYIDKVQRTPGALDTLQQLKKQVMKTKIPKSELPPSKAELKRQEAQREKILNDISDKIEKFLETKVEGGWDFYNKKFKLGLTTKDRDKDEERLWRSIKEEYRDLHNLDDLDSNDEKKVSKMVNDIIEKGKSTFERFTRHLLTYHQGLNIVEKLYEKLGCDEYFLFDDIENAKKAYKTITGKEYK